MYKLPILEIIQHTFSIFEKNKFSILRVLIIPYLMMTSLIYIRPYLVAKVMTLFTSMKPSITVYLINFVVSLLEHLIASLFIISCHRLILLGSSSIPKYGLIIPKKREIRFWGWTVALYILIMIFIAFLGILSSFALIMIIFPFPFILPLLGYILGTYLFARYILIFPAVALDHRPTLDWAWKQTNGNGFRLLLLLAMTALPIYFLRYFMSFESSILLNGFIIYINFILGVIGIIFISLSYNELCIQDYVKN